MKIATLNRVASRALLAALALVIALSVTTWVPIAADLVDVSFYNEALAGDNEDAHLD